MSDSPPTTAAPTAPAADARHAELFASMVMNQAQLAMIFLGQVPHPETGQLARDLQSARHFIDQLEMLEARTRGNLNKQEEGLLRQTLMSVRMGFVEAVNNPEAPVAPAGPTAPAEAAKDPPAPPTPPSPAPDEEERKKFVKKY